jgi:transposase
MSDILIVNILYGMETKDARNLSPNELSVLRERAVKGVLSGRSRVEMSALLGVSRQTIGQWVDEYHQRGADSFSYRARGRQKGGKMSAKQGAQIYKLVIDWTPNQLKLTIVLWSREAVAALIEKRVGIRFSHRLLASVAQLEYDAAKTGAPSVGAES